MSNGLVTFADLTAVATHLRDKLAVKKYILLFAYNGTGKTRLSMAFKELGKTVTTRPMTVNDSADDALTINEVQRDTLYFNAFTEDLFHWDNDLENDERRVMRLNRDSRFFGGLQELEMENRIGPLLARYADFNFYIDYGNWEVTFFHERDVNGDPIPIKVSRGEENIFVWCFFLAVAQLAIDGQEAYGWVKYIYIDDPISSLDDNNTIAVASHLAKLLKSSSAISTVISSHHTLFYNVMCNELLSGRDRPQYFLSNEKESGEYLLRYTGATPFFHHVAMLKELHRAAETGELYTYHFNVLRNILEKTASFHGFSNFSACIKQDENDADGTLYTRMVNILSHGNYSLFEPSEMMEENKRYFRKILNEFMANYRFNPELFPVLTEKVKV